MVLVLTPFTHENCLNYSAWMQGPGLMLKRELNLLLHQQAEFDHEPHLSLVPLKVSKGKMCFQCT